MRDFPSCFGESGVQIADASSSSSTVGAACKNAHNVVTCLYQTQLAGGRVISVTWSRTMIGRCGLSVAVDDESSSHCLCKLEIKPWLFSKKKGSKTLHTGDGRVGIFWDLSAAKFGAGPEPLEGFYVAVLFDLDMALLLGDARKEAYRKTGARRASAGGGAAPPACCVTRRENIYGKKVFTAGARLREGGPVHEIEIECDAMATASKKDTWMEIRVDRKAVMQVKRLAWKFRGNQAILIDGMQVEVFWDVHDWLFSSSAAAPGAAVFMFQTCRVAAEKLPAVFRERQAAAAPGFALILHAWRVE